MVCGVPQGKLGPILFLINDLCANLQVCQTIMLADDTILVFKAKTAEYLAELVSRAIFE